MSKFVQPYLFFDGRCEEAVEFYKQKLGAEVQMMMQMKDSPEPHPDAPLPPGADEKIMHTSFRIGESVIMASDGCPGDTTKFQAFSLSLTVPDEAEADRVFAALSEGGEVQMPLSKTFWSPKFGMVKDKFGLAWMVTVPGGPA